MPAKTIRPARPASVPLPEPRYPDATAASPYHASIFPAPAPDVTQEPIPVQFVSACFRIGIVLEKAKSLRQFKADGGLLSDDEQEFLRLADNLLEVGITEFTRAA